MPSESRIYVAVPDPEALVVGKLYLSRQRHRRLVLCRSLAIGVLLVFYFSTFWSFKHYAPQWSIFGRQPSIRYDGPQVFDLSQYLPDYSSFSEWKHTGSWKSDSIVSLGNPIPYHAPQSSSSSGLSFRGVKATLFADCTDNKCDDRRISLLFNDMEIWRFASPSSGKKFNHTKDISDLANVLNRDGEFKFVSLLDDDNAHEASSGCGCLFGLEFEYFEHNPNDSNGSKDRQVGVPAPTFLNFKSGDKITVPRDTVLVIANVFASGDEEDSMWYSNLVDTSESPDISGHHGPLREVQVHVDGKLAGVTSIVPMTVSNEAFHRGLWENLSPIQSHDILPTYIDLTPFLPNLWEGCKIEVSVRLEGQNNGYAADKHHIWKLGTSLRIWQRKGVKGSALSQPETDQQRTYTPVIVGDRNSFVQVIDFKKTFSSQSVVDFGDGKHRHLQAVSTNKVSHVQDYKPHKHSTVIDVKVGHESWVDDVKYNDYMVNSDLVIDQKSNKVKYVQSLRRNDNGHKIQYSQAADTDSQTSCATVRLTEFLYNQRYHKGLASKNGQVVGCDSTAMSFEQCRKMKLHNYLH